jgi:hypothetical protein
MQMREIIGSIEKEYRLYKRLAEEAFEQLSDEELIIAPSAGGNSLAIIAWHISGNLKSRFTEFLTSDGEKPWRDRESEFDEHRVTHAELRSKWEEGWTVLFGALAELSDDTLHQLVAIRGETLSVHAALHRSLAHTSYHVGQIVFHGSCFAPEIGIR